jgi:chromosomal replication initiation ATPase DnaA
MPAVAMPKDDWTPAKLKTHEEWRRKMYSTPKVALVPVAEPEPEPVPADVSMLRRMEELESMVNRLRSEFIRARIERAITNEPMEGPAPVKLEHIIKVVAQYYKISISDIRSGRRVSILTHPRQVAMYLCRHLTLRSLPEIGRHLGGKDHTTVLHGTRKIEAMMKRDAVFCQEVAELEALFA